MTRAAPSKWRPNQMLREIGLARSVNSYCRTLVQELQLWLDHGGIEPDWDAHPLGTIRYQQVTLEVPPATG